MSAKLIPAVIYIRMSSADQDTSPEQQRAEVKKLAKKYRCRIVREYFDSAISGNDTEKRLEFQRMHRDACNGRDFEVILCWDQDRFGRFDSIEAGKWIHPLREAGVRLITVAQGEIDWNDFAGRMIYNIQQEGKNQYLIDLSRNTTRGRLDAMKRGEYCPRAYGYDRLIYDPGGNLVRRVSFREKFTRPKGWRAELSPSEEVEAVEAVQWLFKEYARSDTTCYMLAEELNRRGVKPARGGEWSRCSVIGILTNPVYTGCLELLRNSGGRYHTVGADGEIVRNHSGKKVYSRGRKAQIVFEDHHPPLVDRATFDAVQEKHANRRRYGQRPKVNSYVLTGVVVCGCCHTLMYGSRHGEHWYYRCHYHPKASAHHDRGGCDRRIRQAQIEKLVGEAIHDVLNRPNIAAEIRKVIEARAKAATRAKGTTESIKSRLRELDLKIDKATENLALADKADIPGLTKLLARWRNQRKPLEAKLTSAGGGSVAKQVKRAMQTLSALKSELETADPMRLRSLYKTILESVTVFWETHGRFRLPSRVVVTFRSGWGVGGDNPIASYTVNNPHTATIEISGGIGYEKAVETLEKLHDGSPVPSRLVAAQLGITETAARFRLAYAKARGLVESSVRGFVPKGHEPQLWYHAVAKAVKDLHKTGKPVSIDQIVERTELSRQRVTNALQVGRRHGLVKRSGRATTAGWLPVNGKPKNKR